MDDVNIFCTDEQAMKRAIRQTEFCYEGSAFKLNKAECDCFGIGNWCNTEINVQYHQIKILGVIFKNENKGEKTWDIVKDKKKVGL